MTVRRSNTSCVQLFVVNGVCLINVLQQYTDSISFVLIPDVLYHAFIQMLSINVMCGWFSIISVRMGFVGETCVLYRIIERCKILTLCNTEMSPPTIITRVNYLTCKLKTHCFIAVKLHSPCPWHVWLICVCIRSSST